MAIEDGIRLIKGNGLFEKIGLLGLIELEDEWTVLDGTNDGVFKFVAGGIDKINGIRDLGPEDGILEFTAIDGTLEGVFDDITTQRSYVSDQSDV